MDMDDLLDSLEDGDEPNVESLKNFKPISKKTSPDESARNTRQKSDDDRTLNIKNNSSKLVPTEMEDVLNELDLEQHKEMPMINEKEESSEIMNESNMIGPGDSSKTESDANSSIVKNSIPINDEFSEAVNGNPQIGNLGLCAPLQTEKAESSLLPKAEELCQTKEDEEVASVLNSIVDKASSDILDVKDYAHNVELIQEHDMNIESVAESSVFMEAEFSQENEEEIALFLNSITDKTSVNLFVSEEDTVTIPSEVSSNNQVDEALEESGSIPRLKDTVEEDSIAEEICIKHSKEVSSEVERILKDDTMQIESLTFVVPVSMPPMIIVEEVADLAEEASEAMTTCENNESSTSVAEGKADSNVECSNEIDQSHPDPEISSESNVAELTETTCQNEQVKTPPSLPIGFDTSEEINEELNEELLRELEQMAEENVNEGAMEAAAIVAAESQNNLESQLEPARSYIPDTPVIRPNTVILSTHDLSIFNSNPPLTESELQLGKTKPYWIPDEDCNHCMLCSLKFTVINRRHHCRCCGRVLCSSCCNIKRILPYIDDSDKKQRVCEPCSKTLDKIDDYEHLQAAIQQRENERRLQNIENERASAAEGSEEVQTAVPAVIPTTVLRKKSVLKSKNSERSEHDQKRTVKFLDGIRPGFEDMDQPGPSEVASSSSSAAGPSSSSASVASIIPETEEPKSAKKKIPKGVHRRNRERRVQEEQLSLVREDHLFIVDCDAQMTKLSMDKVLNKLITGEKVTVAIKRNLWVIIQLVNYRNSKVWFFSSLGMATIGSDELVIAFGAQDFDFEVIDEVIRFFTDERKRAEESKGNNSDSTDNSEHSVTDNIAPPRSLFITSLLYLFDHFFLDSLIPSNESLDEKVGIRRCGERISTFYRVPQGEINGIEAAAIIFHRPVEQNFENLPIPSYSPFLIGTFVQKSELIWAMTIPNRLLLKIGLQASHFPFPIVNARNRVPAYMDSSENTVLKVFNDFKNWSYRLPKILGSTVEIENGATINIRIPKWAIDDIKQILESNRNMLAWATSLTDHSDCHLVAIQNPETATFRTEIFTDVESTREKIGCNFIVLDGSLKNATTETFQMSIVEDGVIVRVASETLEEMIKALTAGAPYTLSSSNMNFNIIFVQPFQPKYKIGALLSPIDHLYLIGKYQYGLNLSRQFRSQMLIPNAPEWAMRLSTVINIDDGKIPVQLQPRYFEICEQVGVYMAGTIGNFVKQLTISDQRQICIRIRIESDTVTYDTAKWHGLEQEHYVWTAALDDQLIPYLYQLSPLIPNSFHMELHFSLISIRLLSNVEY